jgi:two-component system nitrogen regulation response regulator NtrX
MSRLLLVDDDANTLASLSRAFRLAGHEAVVCDSADRALQQLKENSFDMILSDVAMPGKDGLTLLSEIRALGITTPVVMVSGQATVDMAVRATRMGALDFLEKPLSTDKLLLTVENAVKLARLEDENKRLRQKIGKHDLVWQSGIMQRMMIQVERVASSETRVCILGETGTGKELIARTIHDKSRRRSSAFITLNCAAVPAELIESELFGHEKGSFTGAASKHIGKFEQANGGTLFLDEIGDMPAVMQTKLLRVLEQGQIERVGGDRPVEVDVRVVVATHRNLDELTRQGHFRQDLYHRIYVFPVFVPPLRDRIDDIPLLADYFANAIIRLNDWKPTTIAADAYEALKRYDWPGNIRELRNVMERLLLLCERQITASDVGAALGLRKIEGTPPESSLGPLAERVENFERTAILEELKKREYRMTDTAKALGLERSHLYKKCQQLSIDVKAMREQE